MNEVLTKELLGQMFDHIAPINYGPVVEAFLGARYSMEFDVEIELGKEWRNSGARIDVRPFFADSPYPREAWTATAQEIASFLTSVVSDQCVVFGECAVRIVETVYA